MSYDRFSSSKQTHVGFVNIAILVPPFTDHHAAMNKSTCPPSSPPLVWVTQGREEHPAYLLEADNDASSQQNLVRWASNQQTEWVDSESIKTNLSPRRSMKRPLHCRGISSLPSPKRTALDCQEESSDDDVEFLLTILPPSPAKKGTLLSSSAVTPHTGNLCKATVDTNEPSSTCDKASMVSSLKQNPENMATSKALMDQGEDSLPRVLWENSESKSQSRKKTPPIVEDTAVVAKELPTPSPAKEQLTPTKQSNQPERQSEPFASNTAVFSFKRSAYVQSLAEICHTILWDARWRVGSRRLFSWEEGEDLSVVTAFSKRYIPERKPAPKSCACLLCKDKFASSEVTCNQETQKNLEGKDFKSNDPFADETEDVVDGDDSYDRSLNLYARLYFRKGPWFRLDDMFKYYLPRKDIPPNEATLHYENSPSKPTSPNKFFLPRSQTTAKRKNKKGPEKYIDQDSIDSQMDSISLLLNDVQHLHRIGFVRSFRDEQECGKTIGEVQKYGLLRQDEQRQILAKLGCKRNIPPTTYSVSNNTDRTKKENLIWKQMRQQRSIASIAKKRSGVGELKHLLPVSKHLDQALLQSWATSIVLKASRVDYIPAAVLRNVSQLVKASLSKLMCNLQVSGLSIFCLRLREAPVSVLRRFSRLYLCATSGPGDMRGDGMNAWRSLPESHAKDLTDLPLATNVVPAPGSHSWHQITYPGQAYRFRLISCNFMRAYRPLQVSEKDSEEVKPSLKQRVQVFSSIYCFRVWEICVELRANVDYLVELNDLLHYNTRRQAREQAGDELEDVLDSFNTKYDESTGDTSKSKASESQSGLDFLNLLTPIGREKIIQSFFSLTRNCSIVNNPSSEVIKRVEEDTTFLLFNQGPGNEDGTAAEGSRLQNDCEKILAVISIIAIHVLASRNCTASDQEVSRASSRPWLRHLWWEGCLAYILWDIIPILERRGYYEMAVKALEVLLFGRALPRDTDDSIIPKTMVQNSTGRSFLAQIYLSRRARGKAYERLMIDYVHILRQEQRERSAKSGEHITQRSTRKKQPKQPPPNEIMASLCKDLLNAYVPYGWITFSATRTLAKRLKQPLADVLRDLESFEARELGHRFSNKKEVIGAIRRYSDWTPLTDEAVANSMSAEESIVGRRCSYIGFEDGGNESLELTSLNVEELAMEYYRTGRLPAHAVSGVNGGWVGWHDEGGKVRTLFRILTSAAVLGMDWGCQLGSEDDEDATIHLTPYQGAPFDLHGTLQIYPCLLHAAVLLPSWHLLVGAEIDANSNSKLNGRRGFYERRNAIIDRFLNRLSDLEPEEVSDLVYSSVQVRLQYAAAIKHSDPALERDIQQVRTLSMLSAGFGGEMLAAVFRCFFFDYRHYSGGLPDLLLVRAIYEDQDARTASSLVDLGDWVGEKFSTACQNAEQAERAAKIFEDQDDEFLGCSKVGDSGGRTSNRFGRGRLPSRRDEPKDQRIPEIPPRLRFIHNDNKVRVECMLVEVKSQNDRLDPRQEDWLNILDKWGNARVCKFGKPKSKKGKGKEMESQSKI